MSGRTPGSEADRAWQDLVALVMDTRDDWRHKVSEATGLPFTRVRALKRLRERPLTLVELASALGSDAPAATVAVNDLEKRGLVEREPHPDDRRAKLVSLTREGRRVLQTASHVNEVTPAAFAALPASDVAALRRILDALEDAKR